MAETPAALDPITFETHPDRYRHLKLTIDGAIATIALDVQEHQGLRPGYALKLNSYDLSVDIELADAVQRLRFEHPSVQVVVVTSAQPGVFSAGANIFMLGTSSHSFKVNFCKFTNETRLSIEEASRRSGQVYIAALNGIASGGGYELALACDEIYLIDDRRSAVALPEVPYLGVLPGTGGLTRVVDKRHVRRDLADVFCTVAEGVKGQRAKDWGLVDDVFPSSRFDEEIRARARAHCQGERDVRGVDLEPLAPELGDNTLRYRHVRVSVAGRRAELVITGPAAPLTIDEPSPSLYPLRMWRELDDALLRLRFNHPDVGLLLLRTEGDRKLVLQMDEALFAHQEQWLARELLLLAGRVLRRLELSAKSIFALIDRGSCFAGSLLELALAADRAYMRDDPEVRVALSPLNLGLLPMLHGLTRLQARRLTLQESAGVFGPAEAAASGLVTFAVDDIDWDDDVRLAIEERLSLSPDALTGMEANLRFVGNESADSKIFARLSAWQNWIFQRPNAVGAKGALTLYGQPESAQFQWERC